MRQDDEGKTHEIAVATTLKEDADGREDDGEAIDAVSSQSFAEIALSTYMIYRRRSAHLKTHRRRDVHTLMMSEPVKAMADDEESAAAKTAGGKWSEDVCNERAGRRCATLYSSASDDVVRRDVPLLLPAGPVADDTHPPHTYRLSPSCHHQQAPALRVYVRETETNLNRPAF
jgi:hypothetical protein